MASCTNVSAPMFFADWNGANVTDGDFTMLDVGTESFMMTLRTPDGSLEIDNYLFVIYVLL